MKNVALMVFIILCVAMVAMAGSVHGAPIVQSGWENSKGTDITDDGTWVSIESSSKVVTAPVHSGVYAAKFTSALGAECFDNKFAPLQTITINAYVNFQNLPSFGKVDCVFIYTTDNNCEISVGARTVAGTTCWSLEDNTVPHITNIPVTKNVWHQVTITGIAGHPFKYSVWIDGQEIAKNQADGGYGCALLNYVGVGGYHNSEAITVLVDDVTVNATASPTNMLPEYPLGGLTAIVSFIVAFKVFIYATKKRIHL